MVDTLTDYAAEREAMIRRQIESRGINDPKIIEAFRSVPREEFLSKEYADLAYGDHPLPIEAGQTISQPYIVALMIQAAEIKPGDRVLEVGAGSGYAAAIMSRIAGEVIAIERQGELVKVAAERMRRLDYDNVRIVEADGTRGWEPDAPYDAIVAAASGSHVPKSWIGQLADGGRIVMPVGEPGWIQKLVKVTKGPAGQLITEDLGGVRFVPLIGEEGWSDG
jgi:protein-L-isoaspartate(D-aspartate) O-methyltransferase